jgi:hypothetical protein
LANSGFLRKCAFGAPEAPRGTSAQFAGNLNFGSPIIGLAKHEGFLIAEGRSGLNLANSIFYEIASFGAPEAPQMYFAKLDGHPHCAPLIMGLAKCIGLHIARGQSKRNVANSRFSRICVPGASELPRGTLQNLKKSKFGNPRL